MGVRLPKAASLYIISVDFLVDNIRDAESRAGNVVVSLQLAWSTFILNGVIGFGIVDRRFGRAKRKRPCSLCSGRCGREGTNLRVQSASARLGCGKTGKKFLVTVKGLKEGHSF